MTTLSLLVEAKFEIEEKNHILDKPRSELITCLGNKSVNGLKSSIQWRIDGKLVEWQHDLIFKIEDTSQEIDVEVLVGHDLHLKEILEDCTNNSHWMESDGD
jgi:hypothetical protein